MRFRRFRILTLMVLIALVAISLGAVIETHNRRAWRKFAALEEEYSERADYYQDQADYCWQRNEEGLAYDQVPFWRGGSIRSWGDEARYWERQWQKARLEAHEYHTYRIYYEARLLMKR